MNTSLSEDYWYNWGMLLYDTECVGSPENSVQKNEFLTRVEQ